MNAPKGRSGDGAFGACGQGRFEETAPFGPAVSLPACQPRAATARGGSVAARAGSGTGLPRIAFGCFTFLRGPAPRAIAGADEDTTCADLWMLRLMQVTTGSSASFGVPELMHCGEDAERTPPDEGLVALALVFPARSVGDVALPRGGSVVLGGTFAAILRNHILLLSALLPTMQRRDLPLVADATAALLAVCLVQGPADGGQAGHPTPSVRRAEVERIIRRNLSSARLDPARISALAGISRSTLYRLFEETGGVARYVRARRLELARDDLCNPALAHRSIGEIAQQHGLYCAASFCRSFRQTFGRTPSEVRSESLARGPSAGNKTPRAILPASAPEFRPLRDLCEYSASTRRLTTIPDVV